MIRRLSHLALAIMLCSTAVACGGADDGEEPATVRIENDFDNPQFDAQPPWTICNAHYLGAEFGPITRGEVSDPQEVEAGVGRVLMVGSFADPECNPENTLPLATPAEEEVVPGQERTIAINLPNHKGPCPPREDIEPIDRESYERISELYPEYDFEPYDSREQNTQCQE